MHSGKCSFVAGKISVLCVTHSLCINTFQSMIQMVPSKILTPMNIVSSGWRKCNYLIDSLSCWLAEHCSRICGCSSWIYFELLQDREKKLFLWPRQSNFRYPLIIFFCIYICIFISLQSRLGICGCRLIILSRNRPLQPTIIGNRLFRRNRASTCLKSSKAFDHPSHTVLHHLSEVKDILNNQRN